MASVNLIAPQPETILPERTADDILNSAVSFIKAAGMSTEALGASPPINVILRRIGETLAKDWDDKIASLNLMAPEPVTVLPERTEDDIVNSSVLFTKLAGIVEGATPPLNLILPVDETFTNDWDADTASLNIISPEPVTVLPLRTTDEIVKLFVLFTKVSGIEAGVTPPINVLTPVEALMPANVCPSITALVNVISPEPVTVLPERALAAIVKAPVFTKVEFISKGALPPINVTTPLDVISWNDWLPDIASDNVISPVPLTNLPVRTSAAIVKAALFIKLAGIDAGVRPPTNVTTRPLADETLPNVCPFVTASVNVIAPVPVIVLPERTDDDTLNSFVLFTKAEGMSTEALGASPPINVIVPVEETLANDWDDKITSLNVMAPVPVTVLPVRRADAITSSPSLFTKESGIEAGLTPPTNVLTPVEALIPANVWPIVTALVKVIAPVPVTVLPLRTSVAMLNSETLFTKTSGIEAGVAPPINVLTPVEALMPANVCSFVTASVKVIAPVPVTVLPVRTDDDILNSAVLFTKTEGITVGASPPTNVLTPVDEMLANEWVDNIASVNVISPEPVTVLPSRTAEVILNSFVLFTKIEGIFAETVGATPPTNVITPLEEMLANDWVDNIASINVIAPVPLTNLPSRTAEAIVKAALFTKVAGIDAGVAPPINVTTRPTDETFPNAWPFVTTLVNVISPEPETVLPVRTSDDMVNKVVLFTKVSGIEAGVAPPINVTTRPTDETFPNAWPVVTASYNVISPEPETVLPDRTDELIINSFVLFTKVEGIVAGRLPPTNVLLPLHVILPNTWPSVTGVLIETLPSPSIIIPLACDAVKVNVAPETTVIFVNKVLKWLLKVVILELLVTLATAAPDLSNALDKSIVESKLELIVTV